MNKSEMISLPGQWCNKQVCFCTCAQAPASTQECCNCWKKGWSRTSRSIIVLHFVPAQVAIAATATIDGLAWQLERRLYVWFCSHGPQAQAPQSLPHSPVQLVHSHYCCLEQEVNWKFCWLLAGPWTPHTASGKQTIMCRLYQRELKPSERPVQPQDEYVLFLHLSGTFRHA